MTQEITIEDVLKDLKAEHSGMEELVRLNKESGYQPDFAEGKMRGLEYAIKQLASLNRQGWTRVEDGKPFVKEGEDNSENVFVICDDKLMIMAYCYIDADEEGSGWCWCNCYGDIHGDPEFDDEYKPSHWMPLPNKPSI